MKIAIGKKTFSTWMKGKQLLKRHCQNGFYPFCDENVIRKYHKTHKYNDFMVLKMSKKSTTKHQLYLINWS